MNTFILFVGLAIIIFQLEDIRNNNNTNITIS